MTGTELENLVVRLTGDGSEFRKMLIDAQAQTQAAAAQVKSAADKIEGFGKTLTGFGKTALGLLGGFLTIKWLEGARQSFEKVDISARKLKSTIAVMGGNVNVLVKDYTNFAKAVAASTTATKGETLAMLRQVETMGISGQLAKEVVRNAIALADGEEGQAEAHLHTAVALAQGNFHLLKRQLGLQHTATDAEVAAKAERMLAAGWENARIQGDSNSAQMARLGRSFGSLKKDAGELVTAGITPIITALAGMVAKAKESEDGMKSSFENTRDTVARAGEIIAFEITHIGEVWDLMVARVEKKAAQFGIVLIDTVELLKFTGFGPEADVLSELIKTSRLREYLTGLADSWGAVASAASDALDTMFKFFTGGGAGKPLSQTPEIKKQFEGLGTGIGEAMEKGLKESGADKFLKPEQWQASLAFSAEAFDKIARQSQAVTTVVKPDYNTPILKDIRDTLKNPPRVSDLSPADLGG